MADAIERRLKRRKLDHEDRTVEHAINIKRVDDLEQILRLRRDSLSDTRAGIRTFKDFLTSISSEEDTVKQSSNLKILKEYCDGQKSPQKYSPSFPHLISTWSFAAETRSDSLLSAVPAVLAQFFKTASRYLEFRDFGLSLCESLLYRDQVRLLERGLQAPTVKPHLISPCLRLLTEVVSFDGGAFASEIFFRRDKLFKRLDVLLDEASSGSVDGLVDKSKPTIRRNAQRFVLANLTFQDGGAKSELILQGRVLQAFLHDLERDSEDIAQEILQAVEKHILNDASIPRNLKSRFLNPTNLASFLKLYDYNQGASEANAVLTVREQAHQFLLATCTDPAKGLLVPQTGWYPAGRNPITNSQGRPTNYIDLGLESPEYFDDYGQSVPVKNGNLSTFAKTLAPEKNTLQAQLLLKIFQAAPELVADYFTHKTKFKAPPKDDPEWLGEFAFLFSVVQLPVPEFYHVHDQPPAIPPPSSIIIESILPRPFTQSMLTKCVNLNQDILSMSAARVITVAIEKLTKVLFLYGTTTPNNFLWSQAISKLREAFLSRCPSVKHIASAATRVPKENQQLRGVILQCLDTFLTEFPEQSSAVKFDVSKYLTEILQRLDQNGIIDDTENSVVRQLPDLLKLAELLPEVRWWQPTERGNLSTFNLLLKTMLSNRPEASILRHCKIIAQSLLIEKGILHSHQSFDAFVTSLTSIKKWSPDPEIFAFLDNCMHRIVQKPVRYLDVLEQAQQVNSDKKPLSLIACCVSEQWAFLAKNSDQASQKNVAEWIARMFSLFDKVGENYRVMLQLQEDMLKSSDEKFKKLLQKAFDKQLKKPIDVVPAFDQASESQNTNSVPKETPTKPPADLNAAFGHAPSSPTSISGLDRWDASSLDSSIPTGRLARLFHCTVSPSDELRRSAFQTLQTLLQAVSSPSSTYHAKNQLYILLGELLETIKVHSLAEPLPSVVPELAALLARILHDPADRMYSKANRFLLRAPRWDLHKLLTYWIRQVLLAEPEHDDGHNLEVDRLLQMLMNGVRTTQDLELYRRAGVWERTCALACSPRCTEGARRKVWGILWRAMQVPGGKGMLIRRAGVGAWLRVVRGRVGDGGEEGRIVDALIREVKEVEGTDEVKVWRERLPIFNKRGDGGKLVDDGDGDVVSEEEDE